MIYRDWHVGMKVVCVGGDGVGSRSPEWWAAWRQDWGVTFPERGEVYSIRDMRVDRMGNLRIRLAEVINPVVEFTDGPSQEPWFHAWSFRPVQPRKTDIAVFTAMLTGAEQREPA